MARLQIREIANDIQRVSDAHAKTRNLVVVVGVIVTGLIIELLVRLL